MQSTSVFRSQTYLFIFADNPTPTRLLPSRLLPLVHRFINNCPNHAGCRFECAVQKNAGVAGYAESFCTVQSDLQASEQARYSVNDVLGLILQKHRKDSALKRISIAGLENAFCKKSPPCSHHIRPHRGLFSSDFQFSVASFSTSTSFHK